MSLKAMICPFFKNSFFFRKIQVHILSTTYKLQQHNSKTTYIYFDCNWLFLMSFWCNIPFCPSNARKSWFGLALVALPIQSQRFLHTHIHLWVYSMTLCHNKWYVTRTLHEDKEFTLLCCAKFQFFHPSKVVFQIWKVYLQVTHYSCTDIQWRSQDFSLGGARSKDNNKKKKPKIINWQL